MPELATLPIDLNAELRPRTFCAMAWKVLPVASTAVMRASAWMIRVIGRLFQLAALHAAHDPIFDFRDRQFGTADDVDYFKVEDEEVCVLADSLDLAS